MMALSNNKGPFIQDLDYLCNLVINRLFLALNSMKDNFLKGISRKNKEFKNKDMNPASVILQFSMDPGTKRSLI